MKALSIFLIFNIFVASITYANPIQISPERFDEIKHKPGVRIIATQETQDETDKEESSSSGFSLPSAGSPEGVLVVLVIIGTIIIIASVPAIYVGIKDIFNPDKNVKAEHYLGIEQSFLNNESDDVSLAINHSGLRYSIFANSGRRIKTGLTSVFGTFYINAKNKKKDRYNHTTSYGLIGPSIKLLSPDKEADISFNLDLLAGKSMKYDDLIGLLRFRMEFLISNDKTSVFHNTYFDVSLGSTYYEINESQSVLNNTNSFNTSYGFSISKRLF